MFWVSSSCVYQAFASGHCCLVVTCWERANLLVLDLVYYEHQGEVNLRFSLALTICES